MTTKSLLIIALFCLFSRVMPATAQPDTPHLLVHESEKSSILQKIEKQPWAGSIFREMKERVDPYANRHVSDPEWILSRYLMNRVPGKRYTRFYSDNAGQGLVKQEGDAQVPTVRMPTWLRTPITEKGTGYRRPEIEELVPYDTASVMMLFNPETSQKEPVDPKAFITDINGEINRLAQDAAILFWLTGEEKYARFSADILDQWARGAYWQEPIIGPCRTGFLDMQTLGDGSYRSLILAFDFVKTFMKQKAYNLQWYETVFEKFASTLAFRGYYNNNWYAAESSTLVFAALSLENPQKRDFYLQFFLERDTIQGGCGQLALPSTVEKWLTPDGHWKEPGGYHNFPVGNLLVSSLALEKNGYDIFRKFPALFRASYAMLKYAFPNLTVSAFGDTGRASQSAESLEIGLWGAVKYEHPDLPEMVASMQKLTEGKRYSREKSGFLGLLCFLPELPEISGQYGWPRTGTLDFAKYFLQRNGMDPRYGLMVGVQGATYNHNHCNGMAMELYGLGDIMGIDAGTGPNYEHPLHQQYFAQWAAHNTVVAGGASSSVPYRGSSGTKDIGHIELMAMEPLPDHSAVSADHSFTMTGYFDKSTNTRQTRTLALIRTSDSTGYYVDIFRSGNPGCNDYVYHNTGDSAGIFSEDGKPLQTFSAEYHRTEKDYPGFRFFSGVKNLENYPGNVVIRFPVKSEEGYVYLQALIAGNIDRDYYTAFSPKTKTAGRFYSGKTVPLFTIHADGEAETRPFVVVFEPYGQPQGNQVIRTETEYQEGNNTFTALRVINRDESVQHIFENVDPRVNIHLRHTEFNGFLGLADCSGEQVKSLYLGFGKKLSFRGYALEIPEEKGSARITVTAGGYMVSCNQSTMVTLPAGKKVRKVALQTEGQEKELSFQKSGKSVTITVPACTEGVIRID